MEEALVNDADIAPLAQRLAEENNVDWRRLRGSGANGRIVERDVLEYLARVMEGEESVDPTPEPLPEGVDAWPEDQRPPPRAGEAAPPEAAPGETPPRTPPRTPPDQAPPAAEFGDDDLLLAGDDLADGEDDLLMGPEAERPPEPRREEEVPDLFDEGVPAEPAGGRGDAPDLFDGDLSWGDEEPADAGPATPPRHEAPDDRGRREDAAGTRSPEDEETFDFGGFPGAGREADTPVAAPDAPAGPRDEEDAFAGDLSGPATELSPDEFTAGEPSQPPPAEPEVGSRDEPARDAVRDTLGDVDPAAAFSRSVVGESPSPQPDAGATPGGLPLARSRQVLRRYVDFGGALAVQRLVSADASLPDDWAVTALLLLAARREAAALGASRPGVAVSGPDGRTVGAVVAGTSVGEVVSELAEASYREAEADLWVADLSGYALDDAVLEGDVPQLTLGRVLSDGDDGGVRATLALAGDVPLDSGAAFLARVAQRIEEPLRLLI